MSEPSNTPRQRHIFLSKLKTTIRILRACLAAFVKRCWESIGAASTVIQTLFAASLKRCRIAIQTAIRVIRTWPVQYFNKFIGFFGVIGGISIVGLLVVGLALTWAWQREELRPIVAVIAAGLGVVLAAAAGFLEKGDKTARWILAISARIFTVLFAWYTTLDLTNQLKEKTETAESQAARLALLADDIVRYVRALPADEYRRVLTVVGFDILRSKFQGEIANHRPPFRSIEFDPSRDIISIIEKLEGEDKNGHALVIKGEIEAALDHPDQGNNRFYKYLAIENESTRNGNRSETACRNPEGLCRQRTAGVFHQLARGLLKQGRNLKAARRPEVEYQHIFSEGLKHACSAVKLNGPNGFVQVPTTRTVEQSLWDELGKGPHKPLKDNACLESAP